MKLCSIEWCKRELTAGLVRELEEKKTLVMPFVIDDCEIPLFLRDKLHADFRRDADATFDLVDRSLAKLSNPLQGRLEQPDFHTDWAVDWKEIEEGRMLLCWTFVDHGNDWPYTILSQCRVLCNKIASERLIRASKRGKCGTHLCEVLECISDKADGSLSVRIRDQFEEFITWKAKGASGASFQVMYTHRRMGEDTGMDTLLHLDRNLTSALGQMADKLFEPNLVRN